ncbi:BrnT family toxin [Bacteroidota bacterium]
MIEFEFDSSKSQRNKEKHGIDFAEAQELWVDPDLLEVPARIGDEPRLMIIARTATSHWSGVVCYRNSKIRIISVRRSRIEGPVRRS